MKFSPLECITLHYALELYKSSIEQVLEEEVLSDKDDLRNLSIVLEDVEAVLDKFGRSYKNGTNKSTIKDIDVQARRSPKEILGSAGCKVKWLFGKEPKDS